MTNMNEYFEFCEIELAKLREKLDKISSKDKQRENEISEVISKNCELISAKDFEQAKKILKEDTKLLYELSKIHARRQKRTLRELKRFNKKIARKFKLKPVDIEAMMNNLSQEDLTEIAKEFGLT